MSERLVRSAGSDRPCDNADRTDDEVRPAPFSLIRIRRHGANVVVRRRPNANPTCADSRSAPVRTCETPRGSPFRALRPSGYEHSETVLSFSVLTSDVARFPCSTPISTRLTIAVAPAPTACRIRCWPPTPRPRRRPVAGAIDGFQGTSQMSCASPPVVAAAPLAPAPRQLLHGRRRGTRPADRQGAARFGQEGDVGPDDLRAVLAGPRPGTGGLTPIGLGFRGLLPARAEDGEGNR